MLKWYLKEIFEPTLLFGFLSALLGISIAVNHGRIDIANSLIVIIGVVLAQISVNTIDDYIDYKKRIDRETTKTRFSGGSALIVDGRIGARSVLAIGTVSFFAALLIGIYLAFSESIIIPFIIIGAFSIIMYANTIVKFPFLSELFVVLSFMSIVAGSYVVSSMSASNIYSALLIGIPIGISIAMALFVNGIPDAKVDKRYGRRSTTVIMKTNKIRSYYYLSSVILAYLMILIAIVSGFIPLYVSVIALALPPAIAVSYGIREYKSPKSFERFMEMNALFVTEFIILAILGYLIL